jgi:hypothetical protein
MRLVSLKDLPIVTKVEAVFGLLKNLKSREALFINKDLQSPKSGYMVSSFVSDVIFNPSHSEIKEVLKYLVKPNEYLGGYNNSQKFIEVYVNIKDLHEALELAIMQDDLTIWDVKNNKEIKIVKR